MKESEYDEDEIRFLENGFTNGFDISYEGPQNRQSTAENIPFTTGDKVELWNKLMKEVKLGPVAGPFKTIPFKNFIQSPIGLVPKAERDDQTRLIFHLSYDFKDGKSLNHFTPKEKYTVKYRDLDYAISTILDLKKEMEAEILSAEQTATNMNEIDLQQDSTQKQHNHTWKEKFEGHKRKRPIYSAKSDLKSAFRILGLSRDSRKWLIMKAEDPTTGDWMYFVDKCLPFGSSISCALFQRFFDALCHLIQYRLQVRKCVTNYLDDFLFVAASLLLCNHMVNQFLKLCDLIGVPVSLEKTVWVSEIMVFLGILLEFLSNTKKKATVRDLQKLCRFLNFISRAVFPDRTFTRRMYAKYGSIINLGGAPTNSHQYKFKQHYHICLDAEFKQDCKVWLDFLTDENLAAVVNCPMIDLFCKPEASTDIQFFSDTSACRTLGFGATLMTKKCMVLLRMLVLNCLKFNRRVSAVYVSSKDNFLSDAMSHNQMLKFRQLDTQMDSNADTISDEIWPIEKIWYSC